LPSDEEDEARVAELDELQTYVRQRTDQIWIGTALNYYSPGVMAMEIEDCSGDPSFVTKGRQ
jgi:hypothetical protein